MVRIGAVALFAHGRIAMRRGIILTASIAIMSVNQTGHAAGSVDRNQDGMSDVWQLVYGIAASEAGEDPDGDDVRNRDEARAGTDPRNARNRPARLDDSDVDDDGLAAWEEALLGTRPTTADSDGDTVTDGDEVHHYGTDPLNASSVITGRVAVVDRNHPSASNSNPGTFAAPWLTIRHAAGRVRPGTTVIVRGGDYPERVTFAKGSSGTAAKPVVFRAVPARTVTMRGFDTENADYLHIEGFNIVDPRPQRWNDVYGIWIASDEVLIRDNDFSGIRQAAIIGSWYRPTPKNARILQNRIVRCQYGIVTEGQGWLVENNEVERLIRYIEDDSDYCRFLGRNHVIRGNRFHGTRKSEIGSAHVDGFQCFGYPGGPDTQHILIENNHVSGFHHQGVIATSQDMADNFDIVIRNNIFEGSEGSGVNCGTKMRDVKIDNNLFHHVGYFGVLCRDNAEAEIRNNIFVGGIRGTTPWLTDSGSKLVTGNNLIYSGQQTYDQAKFGRNDIVNLDPMLRDPDHGDFRLRPGSPAIDRGVAIAGFNVDRTGTPRPLGDGWDIGPLEFSRKDSLRKSFGTSANAEQLQNGLTEKTPR